MQNDLVKTFTFDKVFGPDSSQESVFNGISHMINEVFLGYNCTIFAYGQVRSLDYHSSIYLFRLVPGKHLQWRAIYQSLDRIPVSFRELCFPSLISSKKISLNIAFVYRYAAIDQSPQTLSISTWSYIMKNSRTFFLLITRHES